MKKLILLVLLLLNILQASFLDSNFSKGNIEVLKNLDIESSFISDYKLQKYYQYYQKMQNPKHHISNLNDASLFVPRVKDILKQKGIPDLFLYMAMVESNFSIDARSHVKATGLWQFMDSTASKYGLKNNIYIDERMDLVKSTVAAATYLNSLYNEFGKWYLAVLAYNCGEGRLIEALTRSILDIYVNQNPSEKNSKKIRKFRNTIKAYQERRTKFYEIGKIYQKVSKWNIEPNLSYLLKEQRGINRQYLPKETRRYIRKILALAMLNYQGFITNSTKNPHFVNMGVSTTIATIPVKGGLHLKNIAKVINMTYEELYNLNKHIKQGITPPYESFYTINIPYNKLAKYNENKNSIPNTKFAIHVVKSGDSLYSISRKYKIPLSMIRKYNKLKTNLLSLRQKIVLPISSNKLGKINLFNYKKANMTKKHIVKSGDSLYSISKKYKVDIRNLMEKNRMKTTLLKIGDRIVIR